MFLSEKCQKVKTIFILMILKLWCAGDISNKVKTFHFVLMSLLFLTYVKILKLCYIYSLAL